MTKISTIIFCTLLQAIAAAETIKKKVQTKAGEHDKTKTHGKTAVHGKGTEHGKGAEHGKSATEIANHKAAERSEEVETAVSIAFIVVLLMLLFYMSSGAAIEKYKLSFGHEASFTVVFGKFKI